MLETLNHCPEILRKGQKGKRNILYLKNFLKIVFNLQIFEIPSFYVYFTIFMYLKNKQKIIINENCESLCSLFCKHIPSSIKICYILKMKLETYS